MQTQMQIDEMQLQQALKFKATFARATHTDLIAKEKVTQVLIHILLICAH